MTTKERNFVELKPGERIDDLQRNGYGIIQNGDAFCFGMDAVLLSSFAHVKKNEIAVDMGTGTGIIPIMLEAKTPGKHFYGIEIQEDMAEMASRSLRLNGIEDKVEIINGDLKLCAGDFSEAEKYPELKAFCEGYSGRVDVVTCNPPYMKNMHGLKNPDDGKAIARHELKCSLSDVCHAAARLLKSGGRFYMVHRPLRLPEIISELKAVKLEPKRIRAVYPYVDKEANMILIEAVKGAGAECRFEKPLIVYSSENVYTDEVYKIYAD